MKILCCEHFIQILVDEGRFFKFCVNFNGCDCDSHADVVVFPCEKDDKKEEPTKVKNCLCANDFFCNKCFRKPFFKNHVIYKVHLKLFEEFRTLPNITDYFFKSDSEKYFHFDDVKNCDVHVFYLDE